MLIVFKQSELPRSCSKRNKAFKAYLCLQSTFLFQHGKKAMKTFSSTCFCYYMILLLFNFNYIRDLTNKRKLFPIPVAEYASFSHHARTLGTNLLGLISNFSKYYFKIGTNCLLFLSSHVFTALEFTAIILISCFEK